MKKLKELFKKLFHKKNNETGKVTVLCKLPTLAVHPFDLMENLGIAIVYNTKQPVAINSDELLQFALYDEQNNFLGTFFGVEREERLYGNIIGTDEIIACDKKSFTFKITDEVIYPMGNNYSLAAKFKSPEIFPTEFRHKDISVHKFDEETTVYQAFDYALAYTE